MSPTRRGGLFLTLWLGATTLAVFFANLQRDSAFVDGEYIPRTNDSFYHAHRILDAVFGDGGFYQFDSRLHVPDGAWIPWPWAYDFLIAKALQLYLFLDPMIDPLEFLVYVPVVWVAVNAALFLAALTTLDIAPGLRAVAMLAFALSPLVQLTHAVGMIDHHFVELTFTLLAGWLGLRWFDNPGDTGRSVVFGAVLGIATAFHNGLFILQLPMLASVVVLWIRGRFVSGRQLRAFCGALVASSALSSLPSEALRSGMFEFALLSWFHVYVACCSALIVGFVGLRKFSLANLAYLVAMAAALAVPVIAEVQRGAHFLSADFSILDQIGETHSPLSMFADPAWGPSATASFYSWLLVAVPVLLGWFAWRFTRETNGQRLYFAAFTVFGLALLLTQYRLSYFGLLPMIAAPLVLVDEAIRRYSWRTGYAVVAALVGVFLLYQPALRGRLFASYPPGGEIDYSRARPLFAVLEEACAARPGTVLAGSDDGNALLFHTNCSVIANNFIMRAEDELKIAEARALLHSTPELIHGYQPPITYLLVRAQDYALGGAPAGTVDVRQPLGKQLLLDPEPPPGFKLLHSISRAPLSPQDRGIYARLYEIERD